MGTNYYTGKKCDHCQHVERDRHIGKNSMGWCFALHVYPEEGINTLEDWEKILRESRIFNEYGDEITLDDMLIIITKRDLEHSPRRHDVDGVYCIGRGQGFWDYLVGDFC